MGLEQFITKHFGGVPRSFKDLEWIYRVRPSDPAITPVAEDFRTISPGSQPDFKRPAERKIFNNRYYERDSRRSYPATAVYTSEDIVKLVGAGATRSITSGATAAATDSQVPAAASALPPRAPGVVYRWEKSLPHLKPTDLNRELMIRGVK
ncbi:UNVERIFIED_CONTAM: hypothetical protein HDU68_008034 [Siphonaria sp. JEL0065]|nr:hypothetical protein HDU68_008034 [Siphonaria sp. JEL0065]